MDDMYNLDDCRLDVLYKYSSGTRAQSLACGSLVLYVLCIVFAPQGENDTRAILDNYIVYMLCDTSFGTLAPIARQPLPAERGGAGLLIQRGVFGRC
jgi:hypothetical protein